MHHIAGLLMKNNFNAIIFTFLRVLSTLLLILSTFQYFWAVFWRFEKILKSKMVYPRWRLFWLYDVIVTWYDVMILHDI